MADKISQKIEGERSAAMLEVLKRWAIEQGRWNEHIHGPLFRSKDAELQELLK
ncbi:MAG: hypothetical protein MJH10_21695 [Epibacterium sp.]|nr:hypothetical protein [Epibacterium sp.]NQX76064.1 hypothetical protein [Epibacterium sp.]